MKKFFSKYWLFILLATLATILAGFYFKNKVSRPEITEKLLLLPTLEIESHPIQIKPNLSQLEKNLPSFKLKIEVYQIDSSSLSDQKTLSIAKSFGFQNPPNVLRNQKGELSYNWADEEKNLSINLHQGTINYDLNISEHPEFIKGELPQISEVEERVKLFLKENYFLTEGIELKTKDIYFVKNFFPYFSKVDKKEEADLIQTNFEYQDNGRKIITAGDYPPTISIIIGPEFKIVNFNYYFLFSKIEVLPDLYPTKTRGDITNYLSKNPAISYFISNQTSLDDTNILTTKEYSQLITSYSFNNIELVYYKYDPLQTYLQPVFLITGKATLKDGQQGEVGLYLPAIKDEYLLK